MLLIKYKMMLEQYLDHPSKNNIVEIRKNLIIIKLIIIKSRGKLLNITKVIFNNI